MCSFREGAVMTPIDPSLESSPESQQRRHTWWRAVVLAAAAIVLVPVASYAQVCMANCYLRERFLECRDLAGLKSNATHGLV